MYATEDDERQAKHLGYTSFRDTSNGSSFIQGQRHIWYAGYNKWYSADQSAPGRYENHLIFRDLSKALRRPYPDP